MRTLKISSGLPALAALLLPAFVEAVEYTTLDCPASASTSAASINTAGQIAGSCTVQGKTVAFLRLAGGEFQTVSVPNSAATTGLDINAGGVLLGMYADNSNRSHGFVLDGGVLAPFDAPGATETIPVGINSGGVVAGTYIDGSGVNHGFTRNASGGFRTIDVPGVTDLYVTGINDAGEVIGYGFAGGRTQCFLHKAGGSSVIFEVPEATSTIPAALNSSGQITGWSANESGLAKGFTRDPSGSITIFTALAENKFAGTYGRSINDSGEVAGEGVTSRAVAFSFTQSGASAPENFEDPQAALSNSYGTVALKINSRGEIVGYYYDNTGHLHGFYRQ